MGYWLTLRARSQCRRGYHEDGGAKAEHKQSLQEADCIVTLPIPYRTGRKMLSGPEIVSVTIFQPALPYRTRRCALRMAFWKANSTVPLRVCWRMAWSWFGLALKKTRRRSRHICIRGMPVGESRSDPGAAEGRKPAGAEPPRGGAVALVFVRHCRSGIGWSYPQAGLPQSSPLRFRFKDSS